MKSRFLRTVWIAAGGLLLASTAEAQTTPAGSGSLSGTLREHVRNCGKDRASIDVDVALAPNGAWTADDGETTYAGTSQTRSHRRVRLSFDAATNTALQNRLQAEASAACGQAVTLTSIQTHRARLKVNKRETQAKLRVHIDGRDQSRDRIEAKIHARGPWVQGGGT